MRDMQFSELRGVQRDIIREAFAFPKGELGTVDDVNRASAEAGALMLARGHTVPRLERIKGALNNDFLPMFGMTGKGLEFDYKSPVPEDREADNAERESKAIAFKALTDAGVDHADAAQAVGLPTMKVRLITPVVVAPPVAPAAPTPAVEPPVARAALTAPVRAADGERLPDSGQPNIKPVQEAWASELNELVGRWATVWAAWIDALVEQIRALIARGDRSGLAGIAVPHGDIDRAAAVIKAAMVRLAHQAADQVVHEAADQGIELGAGLPDEDALGATADVVAQNLAREAVVDASREAMHQSPPGVIGDQEAHRISEAVRQRLASSGDEEQREWLGNALTQAQHSGRVSTFKGGEDTHDVPVPAYYASERNDAHTCVFCKEVNGRWLGNSIAEADSEYPSGGYARCLGGIRCRGEVVAVWRPKTTGGDE
jgi:hypothetical protein